MKIYFQYIATKFFKVFFLICVFLLFVIVLFKVIDVLNDFVLSRSMGLRNIFKFAVYTIPQMFVYIAPVSLLCSLIYVHYSMFVDNELTIIQSSGISVWGIVSPILLIAVAVTIISYFFMFFVIPYSKVKIFDQRQIISRTILPKVITAKTLLNISEKISMYIEHKNGDDVKGVIIYDKRESDEDSVIIARNAEVKLYNDSILFKMYNGSRQTVQNHSLQMVFFDTLIFNVPLFTSSNSNLTLDRLDFIDLVNYSPQDDSSHRSRVNEIHKRLSWPLVNLVFVLIAISILFTKRYSREWNKKVMLRIVFYIFLYVFLYFFLKNGINSSRIFIVIMYANSLLFSVISVFYLNYKNKVLYKLN